MKRKSSDYLLRRNFPFFSFGTVVFFCTLVDSRWHTTFPLRLPWKGKLERGQKFALTKFLPFENPTSSCFRAEPRGIRTVLRGFSGPTKIGNVGIGSKNIMSESGACFSNLDYSRLDDLIVHPRFLGPSATPLS